SAWYPIFLTMKDYRASRWDELAEIVIPTFLRERLDLIDAPRNWASFLANGPFVIVLEGLDEYELSFTNEDRDQLKDQLKRIIAKITVPGGVPTKLVITTRTEMFVSDEDMVDFLSGLDPRF